MDLRRGVFLVDVDVARFVGDAVLVARFLVGEGVVAEDAGDMLASSA